MTDQLDQLLADIRSCRLCENLSLGPRPIVQASTASRILLAGQAPGRITHAKGVPFDDPSGNRLREWLGVSRDQFYDPDIFAIIPMGFCFPGTAKGGDLPPRPLCAETWRARLLTQLPNIQLTLVIGQYAQGWHLRDDPRQTLTQRVQAAASDTSIIPLPHPSPRNGVWLKNNPWFVAEVLPALRLRIANVLKPG